MAMTLKEAEKAREEASRLMSTATSAPRKRRSTRNARRGAGTRITADWLHRFLKQYTTVVAVKGGHVRVLNDEQVWQLSSGPTVVRISPAPLSQAGRRRLLFLEFLSQAVRHL